MNKNTRKGFTLNRTDDRDCDYWHSRSSCAACVSKLLPKAQFSEALLQSTGFRTAVDVCYQTAHLPNWLRRQRYTRHQLALPGHLRARDCYAETRQLTVTSTAYIWQLRSDLPTPTYSTHAPWHLPGQSDCTCELQDFAERPHT